MLGYFRKWSIALKRRRLRNERAKLEGYKSIEEGVREGEQRCNNCRAPLTGPFCHICGQRDDDLRRPIWTFFRELMDALFDTDSKIVKTVITLVMMPGGLSRGFNEGRRARFLPPFRLYVVLLFVFFSTLGLADVLILDIHVQPKAEMVIAREKAEAVQEAIEDAREAAEDLRRDAIELQQEHREDEADLQQELLAEQEDARQADRQKFENDLRQKLARRGAERTRDLQKILEGTAQIERELVRDGLIEPGELTGKLEADLQAIPNGIDMPTRIPPVVPEPPTLMNAIEGLDGKDSGDREALQNLLGGLMEQVEEGNAGEKGPRIREAQERVRELLSRSDSAFSEEDREALEGVLAMDADEIERQIEATRGDNKGFNLGDLPYDFDLAMFVANDNETREGIKQEDLDYIMDDPKVPELVKKATSGLLEALKSPREFNKLFNEWLPWAMVVLMPLFALILRVFHWGKRRYYLNQLVFALHFHSFLFVMLTVFAFVLPAVGGDGGFDIFWWVSSVYLIIALKVGQDQGWIRAFFKAGFIWVSYFAIMMTTMAVIMFMGLSDSNISELRDMIENANAGVYDNGDPRTPPSPD